MSPDVNVNLTGHAFARTMGAILVAATPFVVLLPALLVWKLCDGDGMVRRWQQRRALDRLLRGMR